VTVQGAAVPPLPPVAVGGFAVETGPVGFVTGVVVLVVSVVGYGLKPVIIRLHSL
jgi:hypothetical protein